MPVVCTCTLGVACIALIACTCEQKGAWSPKEGKCIKPKGKAEFKFTGKDQTWTVPTGVNTAFVQLWGAGGGKCRECSVYLHVQLAFTKHAHAVWFLNRCFAMLVYV